jgi:hypothetical protein
MGEPVKETTRVMKWVDAYRKAWESNEPADIEALFTDDARYYTEPYAAPIEGRDAIVRDWIERKDEVGDTTWDYDVLAIDGNLAIVRGLAHYKTEPPRTYSNLWEVHLTDEGLCHQFVEWYMKHRE